ncbi:ribokinase [Pantoea sp. B65]|uniref:ribokinase n=1 Tax=Pantoea sp. B65 TaxID=2813359 RepID=UPI0039B46AF8
MGKIVVVGSLHYDIMLSAHHRPEKGETVMGTGCAYKFGGKGGNQAIAAAVAGAEVCFAGSVGDDQPGQFLLQTLQKHSVYTGYVSVLKGQPSGMSVAISDAEGDYGAVVVSNANQHIDLSTFSQEAFWQDVDMLVLQNEVPEAVNLSAAQQAKQRGISVSINAAPVRDISPALQNCIDVLVVNAVEARDMCQVEVKDLRSASLAAQTLAQRFAKVIVTAGEHGVAFCQSGQAVHNLPAVKVKLVSTHGAGDCFMGVLCTSLINHIPLEHAVEKANEAAALHVSRVS